MPRIAILMIAIAFLAAACGPASPADEYTGTLIEGGEGNVWTVMVSEDFSTFTYLLERDGEKRFQIDFDLTKPL